MRVEDFATRSRSYNRSTDTNSVLAWSIDKPEVLKQYFEQCNFKPAVLAKNLGIRYGHAKRLLTLAGLWSLARLSRGSSGGRKKTTVTDKHGYKYASGEHDYYDAYGNKCRRMEHQVVAEKTLGRPLHANEIVHHINLDKSDNRPENLYACPNTTHRKIHQNLEHLAARLVEAGYIAFVPELEEYVYVGPQPALKYELAGGGFLRVVDVLGSDATVVNAARVSFGKSISSIRDQDKKLLKYLADNAHTSPFRHVYVQLHVKAPEFVARQWYKHVVGSEYSFKDMPWNEISGRYVEYDMEYFTPSELRKQSSNNKQGSSSEVVEDDTLLEAFKQSVELAHTTYHKLVAAGVAKEVARTLLPLNFYTEWYWTASLQCIEHFTRLRSAAHAQVEIREYANLLNDAMLTLFPNAWKALSTDTSSGEY